MWWNILQALLNLRSEKRFCSSNFHSVHVGHQVTRLYKSILTIKLLNTRETIKIIPTKKNQESTEKQSYEN